MKTIAILMAFSLTALAGCKEDGDIQAITQDIDNSYRCQSYGGFSEDVCMVSMFRLAAHPGLYETRIIAVNGYVQIVDGDYYVFASQGFSDAKDFSNSLVCGSEARRECEILDPYVNRNVSVFGHFSDKVAIGEWTLRPIGLVEVEKVVAR